MLYIPLKQITKNENFPFDAKKAIFYGFKTAENEYLRLVRPFTTTVLTDEDKSGTCALTVIFIGKLKL